MNNIERRAAQPEILNHRIGPNRKCNDLHLRRGASWCVWKAPRSGVPIRDDAEFRIQFFDLVVEKIPWLRRLFLWFVFFGRAKKMNIYK
ncbi:hypothetical protein DHD05_19410 [Arenibacter sp. N53]|nr:hypothetical protein [Arenibacter sp. N53]